MYTTFPSCAKRTQSHSKLKNFKISSKHYVFPVQHWEIDLHNFWNWLLFPCGGGGHKAVAATAAHSVCVCGALHAHVNRFLLIFMRNIFNHNENGTRITKWVRLFCARCGWCGGASQSGRKDDSSTRVKASWRTGEHNISGADWSVEYVK